MFLQNQNIFFLNILSKQIFSFFFLKKKKFFYKDNLSNIFIFIKH